MQICTKVPKYAKICYKNRVLKSSDQRKNTIFGLLSSWHIRIPNMHLHVLCLTNDKLSFKSHINTICKNAFLRCHQLLRTIYTTNPKIWSNLFKTYILPLRYLRIIPTPFLRTLFCGQIII